MQIEVNGDLDGTIFRTIVNDFNLANRERGWKVKNRFVVGMTTAVLVLTFGGILYAQSGNGDQGGQPGRGEHGRMFAQFMYTFQLMRTASRIPDLNKDSAHALTKAQAKQILAILGPLRTQPKLTPDQAKAASEKLQKVFTRAQLEVMDKMTPFGPRGHRMGAQGQGGPGGNFNHNDHPQGAPRPDGNRPRPKLEENMNPFYAKVPAGETRRQEMVKRMNVVFDELKKKANGK